MPITPPRYCEGMTSQTEQDLLCEQPAVSPEAACPPLGSPTASDCASRSAVAYRASGYRLSEYQPRVPICQFRANPRYGFAEHQR